jgi:hypothetical protein
MAPTPRHEGLLAAGEDGVATDGVVAWLMGFDWRRLPILQRAVGELAGGVRITGFDGDDRRLPLLWLEDGREHSLTLDRLDRNLGFEAHPGWKGRIERAVSDLSRGARA